MLRPKSRSLDPRHVFIQPSTAQTRCHRLYSTTSANIPGTQSIPRPSATRFIYPIILFSLLTSFTINLKASKMESEAKIHKLNGQISVLEQIRAKLMDTPPVLTELERLELLRSIDNDLEMVGLKARKDSGTRTMTRRVSWKEVLLGRDGLEIEEDQESGVAIERLTERLTGDHHTKAN